MCPPVEIELICQGINGLYGVGSGLCGKVGISCRGQDADMAQDLLQFNEIDPCLQHMGGVAVPEGVAGDFFLMPRCLTTAFIAD